MTIDFRSGLNLRLISKDIDLVDRIFISFQTFLKVFLEMATYSMNTPV